MLIKIFKSGNSQAVRLPKKYHFDTDEVEITKQGECIILKPKYTNLANAFYALTEMPEDFMQNGREDNLPQKRECL